MSAPRNPFRNRARRKQFDQCVEMYRMKHRNLFVNGEPHTLNSFAAAFWAGYRGVSGGLYGYSKADREMGSYVLYRAGELIRKSEKKDQS